MTQPAPTPSSRLEPGRTAFLFDLARALGVGLLSGGYGQDELERAGAYRVYQDPADLLRHLDEIGIRGEGGR